MLLFPLQIPSLANNTIINHKVPHCIISYICHCFQIYFLHTQHWDHVF